MKLRILEGARDDLIEGFHFYEQTKEGLGDYFLASLHSDIESLQLYGGIHQKQYRNLYRALSKNFPFSIYYVVENDVVVVQAVLDCRRNPSWTRKRLEKP